ncbi:MAG TPA: flagellar biosynthesis protein FlhA [Vulgatibacter sp.]|nr:flagellar biosynthesis protein FlhA [Vulgatibacter sp.]
MSVLRGRINGEVAAAIAVLSILAILILPVPPVVLDLLLAFSVGTAILMLLVSLGLKKPLEFSVFPSLLLLSTLLRLALNVATTRLILLEGSKGPGAAGAVIDTFGRLMVGGSLIVGFVIFLILLTVNFMVITKGSSRVSEVSARFTLDALPGKQMSIDADLAAGTIDDSQAKARRAELEAETEFFGSMDGASKFVRGDAVAGLAITAINIVGGLIAGVVRDHLPISEAIETYTILTVGDGLVSQIPALLVSTAAGILVTRAEGADLGSQVGAQLLMNPRVLNSTAVVMSALALLPGLPALPFAGLGVGALLLARRAKRVKEGPSRAPAKAPTPAPERIQDLLTVDPLQVDVGYALLPLIDPDRGGELPGRVTMLRRRLAEDLGIVLPSVHLRDDLLLDSNEYRVLLRGQEIGRGVAHADRLMALHPGGEAPSVNGLPAKEPAFGLPAVWIPTTERAGAEQLGLTLVDAASVLTTHLSELLRRHAHEILGRQEVQELLASCSKEAPKLVEEVVPGIIGVGDLVRVLRALVREGVSVRDLRTILEAIADAAPRSKETAFLTEQVRRRLFRQITAGVAGDSGVVRAITLARASEDLLRASLGNADGEIALAPEVEVARHLIGELETQVSRMSAEGLVPVLLAPPDLRRPLFDFASRFLSDLQVVSVRELTPGVSVEPIHVIQLTSSAAA